MYATQSAASERMGTREHGQRLTTADAVLLQTDVKDVRAALSSTLVVLSKRKAILGKVSKVRPHISVIRMVETKDSMDFATVAACNPCSR